MGINSSSLAKREFGAGPRAKAFGFDIIDFHKSRGTRMEYMLHGLGDEWIDITGQRGLTFANLPPGDYILRVKTILDNNIENTTRLLDIHVRPAFHQTVRFIILLATILTGILVVITSYISKLRHEIGHRKPAENELRKLQMYMERILDSMPSALIAINEEGRIDLWNRRARDDYSIPREKYARLQKGVQPLNSIVLNFPKDRRACIGTLQYSPCLPKREW